MIDTSRSTPEADLAFLRAIVEGGVSGRGMLTMGVAYFAGGILYGLQCLFHIGQAVGWVSGPERGVGLPRGWCGGEGHGRRMTFLNSITAEAARPLTAPSRRCSSFACPKLKFRWERARAPTEEPRGPRLQA
jgi:hypothetical protein